MEPIPTNPTHHNYTDSSVFYLLSLFLLLLSHYLKLTVGFDLSEYLISWLSRRVKRGEGTTLVRVPLPFRGRLQTDTSLPAPPDGQQCTSPHNVFI